MKIQTHLKELIKRWNWSRDVDRLGPDMLATHFKMYFPFAQRKICKEKFLHYGKNADFRIGAYAIGCSNIKLGDNVVVRPNCMLIATSEGQIEIQNDVLIAPGVNIYVTNHRFNDNKKPIIKQGFTEAKSVLIKQGSWIGANAVILPGVTVGENAVIAAGSIVTKDVESYTVVAGNPAKCIKIFSE